MKNLRIPPLRSQHSPTSSTQNQAIEDDANYKSHFLHVISLTLKNLNFMGPRKWPESKSSKNFISNELFFSILNFIEFGDKRIEIHGI